MRRHDLAAEIYHMKEPQKIPQILSPEEARRLLAMARVPILNHRERDMVQLIAEGYTSRQIANVLNISSRTVD
jgi:DNA-binding CsgD family transcriptional regulator